MKYELKIIYDEDDKNKMQINGENGFKDPWMDLGLLLEGVSLLVATCKNDGVTGHNGQPLDEYLIGYIKKASEDYASTNSPHRNMAS